MTTPGMSAIATTITPPSLRCSLRRVALLRVTETVRNPVSRALTELPKGSCPRPFVDGVCEGMSRRSLAYPRVTRAMLMTLEEQNNKMKRGARPAPSPTILFTKQEQAVSSHPSTIFIFLFGQAPITGHPRASYRETGLQRPGRSRANTASPATPGHHAYARTHTDIYTHTDWSQTNRMQRQDETRQILDKTKRGAAPARQRIQWW
jgi:hypothetical protein